MYSDIWFPDLLDSEKWLSSLLSIRLNCNTHKKIESFYIEFYNESTIVLVILKIDLLASVRAEEIVDEFQLD